LQGKKLFIDHNIRSIQDYIDKDTLKNYDAIDINILQANTFHTKMMIKEIDLRDYLYNKDINDLPPKKRLEITDRLRKEMTEIFSGMNIFQEEN
jgi:S-adenosylmethionine decarboxylase